MKYKNFRIDYYYSDSCKCCEGYETVLYDIEQNMGITVIYHNVNDEPNKYLTGVPTLILSDGNGIERARWMGKYTYPNLSDKLLEAITNANEQ